MVTKEQFDGMSKEQRREAYAKELLTYSDRDVEDTYEDVLKLERELLAIKRAIKRERLRREIQEGKVC